MPYRKRKFHKATSPKPSVIVDVKTGYNSTGHEVFASRTQARKALAAMVKLLPARKPGEPRRYKIEDA